MRTIALGALALAATIALAGCTADPLAEQYAENMKIGDELNSNMENSVGATEGLTDSINALIEALGGVPPITEAMIEDHGSALEVTGNAGAATAALLLLDDTDADVTVTDNGGSAALAASAIAAYNAVMALN